MDQPRSMTRVSNTDDCSQLKPYRRRKILFPNEHGVWGMFAASFILGWLAAPELSWRPLLILPAALGAFLARYPAGIYFKKRRVARAMKISLAFETRWFVIYSLLTAVVSFPLFYPLGWWWLLIFAALAMTALAVNLWAILRRRERTFLVGFTATTGISFLAPAASYAAILRFDREPVVVWVLLVLYYAWRITAIRGIVARKKEKPVDLKAIGKRELLYSFLFVTGIVVAARIFVRP